MAIPEFVPKPEGAIQRQEFGLRLEDVMQRKTFGPRPEGVMTRPQFDPKSEYACTDCGTCVRSIHDLNLHYQKWCPTEKDDTDDNEAPPSHSEHSQKMRTDDDKVFKILFSKALEQTTDNFMEKVNLFKNQGLNCDP